MKNQNQQVLERLEMLCDPINYSGFSDEDIRQSMLQMFSNLQPHLSVGVPTDVSQLNREELIECSVELFTMFNDIIKSR